MLTNNPQYQQNILALSSKNSRAGYLLRHAQPEGVAFIESRTGLTIPVVTTEDRDWVLHSRVDPLREGRKFSEQSPREGYLVVFGLGAGYHLLPFLSDPHVENILVLETGAPYLKAILERVDLTPILNHPKVDLLLDPEEGELERYVLSTYQPAVAGDLHTLQLQPRVKSQPGFFSICMTRIRETLDALADDYTVQAKFGKTWFTNTLHNMPLAQETASRLPPVSEAAVVGAGPSLDLQLPRLKEVASDCTIIATDTALSALLAGGISPDAVISIDCQHITYHHFLQGYEPSTPIIMDLASPRSLTSFTEMPFFFSSGHPFSQYLSGRWREFPSIDTSGGNVSHAAVSLAHALGARRIFLYGIDFSYPQGKSYARGTYLYPYFADHARRTQSLESLFFHFLFRNRSIEKEATPQGFRYITKPMINYKKRLEQSFSHMSAQIIQETGLGLPLALPTQPAAKADPRIFSSGPPNMHWRDFLTSYVRDLEDLTPPRGNIHKHFAALSQDETALWTTLLPAAASFREADDHAGPRALENAREWTIDTVRRFCGL